MPHAIYLHSALIRDRHGAADPDCAAPMLRTIRLDVALALLASGLASTSVGGYAGSVIMDGLLRRRIPLLWRRVLTAIPALVLLSLRLEPW
jgi:manganese transport protein